MSRSLSTDIMTALYASRTGAVFCALITISHTNLTTPLHLTNNVVDLVYGSITYTAFPFTFDPPDENENSRSNAKLTIDATDQSIMQLIRELETSPTISIDAIYVSEDGGTIEKIASWPFQLKNVSGDVNTITGDLVFDDFLDVEMGPLEMTVVTCPGVN